MYELVSQVTVELQKANESVCRIQSELALSQNKNTELEEVCYMICMLRDRQLLFCTK